MNAQVTFAGQQSQRVHPKTRGAFTLVELLVVITIIGILVALLIPAVGSVMANAKNAQMGIEIASLAQAMEAYKLDNLAYPPDFATPTIVDDKAQLDAHLARKYRYRSKTDIEPTIGLKGLDPAEALVFWLSGLSADPKFPILNRERLDIGIAPVKGPVKGSKPFFEFDQKRLDDRDEDGWPEYYPQNSEMPYVYLSHQNYGEQQADGSYKAYSHAILDNGTGSSTIGVRAYASELAGANIKQFVEPEKYQILCAGQDNEFGAGMELATGNTATFPDGIGYREADDDNLTSFSEGSTLKAALP